MKSVHYGIIGIMGVLVGVLLMMVVVYPPEMETVASRAQFAPSFQTDAGAFGLPGQMIGISLAGSPLTASSLSDDIADMGYDLDLIGSGGAEVPRLFIASLPSDLETLNEEEARKVIFFKVVLPLVLYANEEILADRKRLWRIRYQSRQGLEPSPLDRLWLVIKAEEYRVVPGDLDELARRMDIVPPSVALAQAAIESGWGTSALVRQRNALFGQPVKMTMQAEIVNSSPLIVGMTNEAWNYDTLMESVRAYVRNLNVDPAYEQFRRSRAEMRSDGAPVDGELLASHLKSALDADGSGVDTLRTIIETNGLRRLDDARLQYVPSASGPST